MAAMDLTGQRFGILTAKALAAKAKNGTTRWACVCDCGKSVEVRVDHLRNGATKSCGCLKVERIRRVNNAKDLLGARFGRLTVIERSGSKGRFAAWLCQCDCGETARVRSVELTQGNTKSCGCLVEEVKAERSEYFAALRQLRHESEALQRHEESKPEAV